MMNRVLRPHLALLLGLAVVTSATSCRSHKGIADQYRAMHPAMASGDWNDAARQLEESKAYEDDDRVMYWLNLGTLRHYGKDYPQSQEVLQQAETAMQQLWTTSISGEASKVLVSESSQPYPGEDFEKVLLYFYTSLNRVYEGRMDDALVEARRADELLKKMKVHYEKEGGDALYVQDAFMLWMVGLFYEIEGSYPDAYQAYKASYDAYEKDYLPKFGVAAPAFLAEDIARTGELGQNKSASALEGKTARMHGAKKAEVILIHGAGEVPHKSEKKFTKRTSKGTISIALPEFKPIKYRGFGAMIQVDGQKATTELAEPVQTIAMKNYDHHLGAVKARAFARAVAKFATIGRKERQGGILGKVGSKLTEASEQADLRGWTTLPAHFAATRLWAEPGEHQVSIRFVDQSGSPMGAERKMVLTLKAGEKRIVSVRSLR